MTGTGWALGALAVGVLAGLGALASGHLASASVPRRAYREETPQA